MLRKVFSSTRFFSSFVDDSTDPNNTDIYVGPPAKIGNWSEPPRCVFGIPGITRSVTIWGKSQNGLLALFSTPTSVIVTLYAVCVCLSVCVDGVCTLYFLSLIPDIVGIPLSIPIPTHRMSKFCSC